MRPLRVLITNLSLSSRSGTETYTRDLAFELLRQGHRPLVYSPMPGVVASELRRGTVPVVDDLTRLGEPPDVIHGHHNAELMTALLHFPGVPALFVCHDRGAWHDAPPRFPRLRRYVAVDEACRDRMVAEHGIDPPQVVLILNAVDLRRYRPRSPLPPRPRRALAFSHYAAEHNHLRLIRAACARAGLELDVAGNACGKPCERPEEILPEYDVVFAKARCALEALAVGAAVILCDHWGTGPLVSAANLASLRRQNFGRRTCSGPLRVEPLLDELARYSAADAAEVSRLVREEAGVEAMAAELVGVYRVLIREQQDQPADPAAEARAAARYLRELAPFARLSELAQKAAHLETDRDGWRSHTEQLQKDADQLRAHIEQLQCDCHELRAYVERLENDCHQQQARAEDINVDRDQWRECAEQSQQQRDAWRSRAERSGLLGWKLRVRRWLNLRKRPMPEGPP